jgi:hypothetical protein
MPADTLQHPVQVPFVFIEFRHAGPSAVCRVSGPEFGAEFGVAAIDVSS